VSNETIPVLAYDAEAGWSLHERAWNDDALVDADAAAAKIAEALPEDPAIAANALARLLGAHFIATGCPLDVLAAVAAGFVMVKRGIRARARAAEAGGPQAMRELTENVEPLDAAAMMQELVLTAGGRIATLPPIEAGQVAAVVATSTRVEINAMCMAVVRARQRRDSGFVELLAFVARALGEGQQAPSPIIVPG
jgi:hypothetical protein